MLFVKFTFISEIGHYNGLEIKPYMLHMFIDNPSHPTHASIGPNRGNSRTILNNSA